MLSGKQQTEHQWGSIGRKLTGLFQKIASVHLHRVRNAGFVRLGIHIFNLSQEEFAKITIVYEIQLSRLSGVQATTLYEPRCLVIPGVLRLHQIPK
jgi:hypothetical protein